MTRKLCMLLAVALAVTGALATPAASAQGEPTCVLFFGEQPAAVTPTPAPTAAPSPTTVVGTDNAQPATSQTANITAAPSCADAQAYPGPFTNMPSSPASPYSAPIGLRASAPIAAPAAPAEPPSTGLAHSGSEVFVLAYLGTGLLAFGAVALGMRRSTRVD